MTQQETLAQDNATDAATLNSENQAQPAKTFTQDEVNAILARTKTQLEKKFASKYEELGDPEQLRQIKTDWEKKQEEAQVKRGEFEKILQEKAQRWESEIQKRDSVIKEYKVNTPLLAAAAKYNAVNAEQVKALLGTNVRLNDGGDVEVVDAKGAVRYNDKGEPIGVDDLVREFLDSNPHFKLSNPATTNTKSNIVNKASAKIDISKLDMNNPEHRAAYKEHRKSIGLR
jgi:hypothetical protein